MRDDPGEVLRHGDPGEEFDRHEADVPVRDEFQQRRAELVLRLEESPIEKLVRLELAGQDLLELSGPRLEVEGRDPPEVRETERSTEDVLGLEWADLM